MARTANLPDPVYAEVKFSSGGIIQVPSRELKSLQGDIEGGAGILAALFWCGDRDVDGRWLMIDANESFGSSISGTVSVSKDKMRRASKDQRWLDGLRQRIDERWRPFLQAFREEAAESPEVLRMELRRCHNEHRFNERLSTEAVLDVEHEDAVRAIVDRYDICTVGRVLQDLFAYLLSCVGYTKLMVNPIGVPDVLASECERPRAREGLVDIGPLTLLEAQRLVDCCARAGDVELAERVGARIRVRRRY